MANTRCFDSANNSILSASELSSEKRQQTIYTEIQKNIQHFQTANPVKKNGKKYNRNTIVNSTCDISSGYVEVARSYALLMDVKDGAATCYPVVVSTPIDSIQSTLCSNLCGNTFDQGFQDTSGNM
jgi:protease II